MYLLSILLHAEFFNTYGCRPLKKIISSSGNEIFHHRYKVIKIDYYLKGKIFNREAIERAPRARVVTEVPTKKGFCHDVE